MNHLAIERAIGAVENECVDIKSIDYNPSAGPGYANHLGKRFAGVVDMAKYALGPATIESVIGNVETLGVAKDPDDRQARAGRSLFAFRDHGITLVHARYESLASDQAG